MPRWPLLRGGEGGGLHILSYDRTLQLFLIFLYFISLLLYHAAGFSYIRICRPPLRPLLFSQTFIFTQNSYNDLKHMHKNRKKIDWEKLNNFWMKEKLVYFQSSKTYIQIFSIFFLTLLMPDGTSHE